MKRIILLLSAFLPLHLVAQVMFTFENGIADGWIFSPPGRWAADTMFPVTGKYSLHHVFDNSTAGTDVAMTDISGLCLSCSKTVWKFTVRHGAEPSASNRWSFLLFSDAGGEAVVSGSGFNGFAAGVNMTGYDDTLRLWHIIDGKATAIITSDLNWQTDVGISNPAEITVIREADGRWELVVTWGSERGSWNGVNASVYIPRHAGIIYSYTSTRDRLLWLDDVSVSGVFVPDTVPPLVESVTAMAPNILQVVFTEDPDGASMLPSNFIAPGDNTVVSIKRETDKVYRIELLNEVPLGVRSVLIINSLCDSYGNCGSDVSIAFYPVYAVTGDVVISEIMADPSPPLGLPEEEYLEVTNLTADSLSLHNWLLIAGSDTSELNSVWISPDEALILCSAKNLSKYEAYGRVLGLTSFPVINDGGETLALRDGCGHLIHAVSFSPELYNDEIRSGGGWSVELADLNNPFNEPEAWKASADPSGGSPGRANAMSISAPDNSCPEIIAAWPLSTDRIKVLFDETLTGALDKKQWSIDSQQPLAVWSDDVADRSFVFVVPGGMGKGRIYRIMIPSGASDYAGNAPCLPSVTIGVPEEASTGDVLFNELLFDPVPPCTDYAELYNNSGKVIDMSHLFFSAGGNPSLVPVSNVPRQLHPGGYVALTEEKRMTGERFPCADLSSVHEIPTMVSMPDEGGVITLFNRDLQIIDRVEYSPSMHLVFITAGAGISLEKVSPKLSSGNPLNWHSAAQTCNWGTPGAANSVLLQETGTHSGIFLSSDRLSPDGDGYEDVLSLTVNAEGIDNIVTILIFNDRGFIVRRLAERFVAGHSAVFVWDGTGEGGLPLPSGLYVVMAELFNSGGKACRWKDVVAVLYR